MKTINKFNFNIVKDKHLNEMAYIRSKFKNKIMFLTGQIIENWILIRYCVISNRIQTKKHWQSELFQKFLEPLNKDSIKKTKNQKEAKYSIFIQYWIDEQDFNKRPETILSYIKNKIKEENIKINNNLRKAIMDFCNYGLQDLAYLISYGTEEDIKDYAYGDLDKLEI